MCHTIYRNFDGERPLPGHSIGGHFGFWLISQKGLDEKFSFCFKKSYKMPKKPIVKKTEWRHFFVFKKSQTRGALIVYSRKC